MVKFPGIITHSLSIFYSFQETFNNLMDQNLQDPVMHSTVGGTDGRWRARGEMMVDRRAR